MIHPDYKRFPFHGVGFTVRNSDLLTALLALERHKLYKLEDNHLVVPTLRVTRKQVIKDIRNALVAGNIPIRDDDVTKYGQYRSDWIVLDELAFRICSLRRGGYGAILELRQVFEEEHVQWNRLKPFKDKEAALRKSAYAKLTPDERRAVGISNLKGVK